MSRGCLHVGPGSRAPHSRGKPWAEPVRRARARQGLRVGKSRGRRLRSRSLNFRPPSLVTNPLPLPGPIPTVQRTHDKVRESTVHCRCLQTVITWHRLTLSLVNSDHVPLCHWLRDITWHVKYEYIVQNRKSDLLIRNDYLTRILCLVETKKIMAIWPLECSAFCHLYLGCSLSKSCAVGTLKIFVIKDRYVFYTHIK